MPTTHIVGKGECLSSIAKQYRFSNWRTIYDYPDNADFRAKRPNPNIIYAGDELVIPDREFKEHDRPTDQKHPFVRKAPKTWLTIVVQDASGQPLEGKKYKLTIQGISKPFQGTVGDGGLVEVEVHRDSSAGTLTVFACGGGYTWPLDIGDLDPIEQNSGVIGRLQNLAYDISDDAAPDELADILKGFQVDHQLPPSGQMDDATHDKLIALHDSSTPESTA